MTTLADKLAAAFRLHGEGQLDQAEALYDAVLAEQPRQPNALYLSGLLNLGRGDAERAVPLLREALSQRPEHEEGRFALGNALYRLGKRQEAIAFWRAIIAANPGHVAAQLNLSMACRATGDAAGALAAAESAVAAAPDRVEPRLALAAALHDLDRLPASMKAWRAALVMRPGLAAARAGLSLAMLRTGAANDALAEAREAVKGDDGSAEAWFAFGSALSALGQTAAATEALLRATALDPAHARARLNLGNALLDLDRRDEAEKLLREAASLDATLAEARASLGFLLAGDDRCDEAIAACEEAIAQRPDFGQAHWNLSFALLRSGRFERGWEEYEWRKRHEHFGAAYRHGLSGPEWRGEALGGRTILVQAEQGLGDTIQLARYASLLSERGARTILACDARLVSLLGRAPGVTEAVDKAGPLPPYDYWIDQMSLPRLFGTRLDSVPSPGAYLAAPAASVSLWRSVLPPGRKFGIVWAGNPLHSNDTRRSMSIEAIAPLVSVPGLRPVSLQVGRQSGLIEQHYGIPDRSAALSDFDRTAGLITSLDAVVAVDTSTAHLAGALGCRCFVMLPFAPDWRWLAGRDDTPWYETMRSFRQDRPGDWSEPVARVRAALLAL